jgi:hypothetical protein
MGEITILSVFLASGLSVGLARVVRERERRDAMTRDWIQFLQEDLSTATL